MTKGWVPCYNVTCTVMASTEPEMSVDDDPWARGPDGEAISKLSDLETLNPRLDRMWLWHEGVFATELAPPTHAPPPQNQSDENWTIQCVLKSMQATYPKEALLINYKSRADHEFRWCVIMSHLKEYFTQTWLQRMWEQQKSAGPNRDEIPSMWWPPEARAMEEPYLVDSHDDQVIQTFWQRIQRVANLIDTDVCRFVVSALTCKDQHAEKQLTECDGSFKIRYGQPRTADVCYSAGSDGCWTPLALDLAAKERHAKPTGGTRMSRQGEGDVARQVYIIDYLTAESRPVVAITQSPPRPSEVFVWLCSVLCTKQAKEFNDIAGEFLYIMQEAGLNVGRFAFAVYCVGRGKTAFAHSIITMNHTIGYLHIVPILEVDLNDNIGKSAHYVITDHGETNDQCSHASGLMKDVHGVVWGTVFVHKLILNDVGSFEFPDQVLNVIDTGSTPTASKFESVYSPRARVVLHALRVLCKFLQAMMRHQGNTIMADQNLCAILSTWGSSLMSGSILVADCFASCCLDPHFLFTEIDDPTRVEPLKAPMSELAASWHTIFGSDNRVPCPHAITEARSWHTSRANALTDMTSVRLTACEALHTNTCSSQFDMILLKNCIIHQARPIACQRRPEAWLTWIAQFQFNRDSSLYKQWRSGFWDQVTVEVARIDAENKVGAETQDDENKTAMIEAATAATREEANQAATPVRIAAAQNAAVAEVEEKHEVTASAEIEVNGQADAEQCHAKKVVADAAKTRLGDEVIATPGTEPMSDDTEPQKRLLFSEVDFPDQGDDKVGNATLEGLITFDLRGQEYREEIPTKATLTTGDGVAMSVTQPMSNDDEPQNMSFSEFDFPGQEDGNVGNATLKELITSVHQHICGSRSDVLQLVLALTTSEETEKVITTHMLRCKENFGKTRNCPMESVQLSPKQLDISNANEVFASCLLRNWNLDDTNSPRMMHETIFQSSHSTRVFQLAWLLFPVFSRNPKHMLSSLAVSQLLGKRSTEDFGAAHFEMMSEKNRCAFKVFEQLSPRRKLLRMAAMAFGCIKRGSTVEPIFTECLKEHTEKRLKTQTSLTACMQAWVAGREPDYNTPGTSLFGAFRAHCTRTGIACATSCWYEWYAPTRTLPLSSSKGRCVPNA